MPDQPSQSEAGPLLKAYLADRDIPCHACGYNLRGVTTVLCPECGAVIPRPPADAAARLTAEPASLKLYCQRCGYTVSGHDPGRCPECSAEALASYSGERPPRVYRTRLPRGLPMPLAAIGLVGLVVFGLAASAAAARAAGSPAAAGPGQPILSAFFAAIPPAMVAWWLLSPPDLSRMGAAERKLVRSLVHLVAGGSVALALWTMR